MPSWAWGRRNTKNQTGVSLAHLRNYWHFSQYNEIENSWERVEKRKINKEQPDHMGNRSSYMTSREMGKLKRSSNVEKSITRYKGIIID